MMAGTGVSVGGAGMLRARRRDVSVKPNRKLDRKSSRGMIYENEELRLRTIHINAEVEQGQNDIKKLRRENEQLRREIWSLRDEYDKLEEILKRQKNQDESEEYEDRSEEDDDVQSDYSCEEDEEEPEAKENIADEDVAEDCSTKEQLENVENDKISSEKMSNSLHRLHVDFDDLSVVDEEEEVKKEKERKELASPEGQQGKSPAAVRPRQLHENIPFYPSGYAAPNTFNSSNYYAGCPFDFPNTIDLMLPSDAPTLLASPPPRSRADPLIPLASLDAPNLQEVAEPMLPQLHMPPAGWRANVVLPEEQSVSYPTMAATSASLPPTGIEAFDSTDPRFPRDPLDQQRFALVQPSSRKPGLFARRKPPNDQESFGDLGNQYPNPELHPGENGWMTSVNASTGVKVGDYGENRSKKENASMEGMFTFDGSEKPKHFFSPLPSKVRKQTEEGSPTPSSSQFGTGTSSSSGRTASTVVSKGRFSGQKGCADIYVNGAVPCEESHRDEGEQKAFLSSDNLLMADSRSTTTQLMKSISCQDLTESQSGTSGHLRTQFGEKPQMFTQSDNTLDSISNETSKPYKSHLSVTLKPPRLNQAMNLNPPDTPKLPSTNYRLFNNPFLKTFDPSRQQFAEQDSPVTRPLSIQVNDDNSYYHYPSPPNMSTFSRRAHTVDRHMSQRGQSDRNRLLIPTNQLFPSKTMSPRSKPEVQITSFEKPSPHTLVSPGLNYDINKFRRINPTPYFQGRNLYQNVPFHETGAAHFYPHNGPMRLYYETLTPKVSTQTQTSIDGDSHRGDEQIQSHPDEERASTPGSPNVQRLRKAKKERDVAVGKDPTSVSPGANRRLKKQSSVTSSETIDSPSKVARKRPRKLSVTTPTPSDAQEDKNESRSSSSGQDSPRKEQTRRVSLYFNAKKRPSLTSVKTTRSASVDITKDKYLDGSERERTNSISSRETSVKPRKASTSSGNVPWCACWGNGCI